MKTKLKAILLIVAASFILFSGCKKSDSFIPPSAQSSAVSDELNSAKRTEVFTTTTTLTSSGTHLRWL